MQYSSLYSCYNSLLLRTFRRFRKFFRQFVSPTINAGLGGGECALFMHPLFYSLTIQSSSVLFFFCLLGTLLAFLKPVIILANITLIRIQNHYFEIILQRCYLFLLFDVV